VTALALSVAGCGLVFQPITPTVSPTPSLIPSPTVGFPTLLPTPTLTPLPSLTPTPDIRAGLGRILYQDDFSGNVGWLVGQNDFGGTSLLDGQLVLSLRVPGGFRYALSPAGSLSDFFLEVTLRTELCGARDEFGVVARFTPEGNHYRFSLTCDGGARISRVLDGSVRGLVPITQTNLVIAGAPAENRIGVWARGSDLRFYINGTEAFSLRNAAFRSGTFGLMIRSISSSQLTVSFDDLVVYDLATPAATPPLSSSTPSP
jgi:hypothetical protein